MNGRTNDELGIELTGLGDRIELIKGNECTTSIIALYAVLYVQ